MSSKNILVNVMEDLFSGLEEQKKETCKSMPNSFLKCLSERIGENQGNDAKTRLKDYLINVFQDEINIAIGTALEKNLKNMLPPPPNIHIKEYSKKDKVVEPWEVTGPLYQRINLSHWSTTPPPNVCTFKKEASLPKSFVSWEGIKKLMGIPVSVPVQTLTPTNESKSSKMSYSTVSLLRKQFKELQNEIVKKHDLETMEKKLEKMIAKAIKSSGNVRDQFDRHEDETEAKSYSDSQSLPLIDNNRQTKKSVKFEMPKDTMLSKLNNVFTSRLSNPRKIILVPKHLECRVVSQVVLDRTLAENNKTFNREDNFSYAYVVEEPLGNRNINSHKSFIDSSNQMPNMNGKALKSSLKGKSGIKNQEMSNKRSIKYIDDLQMLIKEIANNKLNNLNGNHDDNKKKGLEYLETVTAPRNLLNPKRYKSIFSNRNHPKKLQDNVLYKDSERIELKNIANNVKVTPTFEKSVIGTHRRAPSPKSLHHQIGTTTNNINFGETKTKQSNKIKDEVISVKELKPTSFKLIDTKEIDSDTFQSLHLYLKRNLQHVLKIPNVMAGDSKEKIVKFQLNMSEAIEKLYNDCCTLQQNYDKNIMLTPTTQKTLDSLGKYLHCQLTKKPTGELTVDTYVTFLESLYVIKGHIQNILDLVAKTKNKKQGAICEK